MRAPHDPRGSPRCTRRYKHSFPNTGCVCSPVLSLKQVQLKWQLESLIVSFPPFYGFMWWKNTHWITTKTTNFYPPPLSPLLDSNDTCKLPGCSNPKYRERNGLQHDFCGRTHAQQYKQMYGFTPPPPSYYGMKILILRIWQKFPIFNQFHMIMIMYLILGASPFTVYIVPLIFTKSLLYRHHACMTPLISS